MKILSIDVGIKNLAFWLFEKDSQFKINKWGIVNLSSEEEVLLCNHIEKDIVCNKPAKYQKDGNCFCLKHCKKQPYQLPSAEHKPSAINKCKIAKLHEIAGYHNITYDPKIKKADLSLLINEYIYTHFLNPIEIKKADEVDLFNIGKNLSLIHI